MPATSFVASRSSIERIPAKNYRDLDVWKLGIDIVDAMCDLTRTFPAEERFGLTTQMQRAASSIPCNIAEGFARRSRREYLQFCSVALGSCAELETQVTIANRRHYLDDQASAALLEQLDHESRMLMNLMKRLR